LTVKRIGNSSLTLQIEGRSGAELRCKVKQTIVCVDMESRKSRSWPDQLQSRLIDFMGES
ncbi:MAG: acyl-CoA thioesterase, partial [Proteobacteria bacterium]|nr:acyl-CoA thioesterase [Pseudomonadota bacterium]